MQSTWCVDLGLGSQTVARLRQPWRSAMFLTLAALASLTFAGRSWGQDGSLPPVEPDKILDRTTGQQAEVTILSATKNQLFVRRDKVGKQDILDRERYEIVRWDGVTNAEAILKACEWRGRGLSRMFDEIVLRNEPARLKQLAGEHSLIQEALGRILRSSPPASQTSQRAAALKTELEQWSAVQAHQQLPIVEKLVKEMVPLDEALRNERFDKVPEICRAIDEEWKQYLASTEVRKPLDAVPARVVVDRMKAPRDRLQAAAAKLKPLPGQVPPDRVGDLPRLLEELLQQNQALQSLEPASWLGPPIDTWCIRRRERVEELGRHVQRLVQLTGLAAQLPWKLAAAKKELEKDDPDWDAVNQDYAALEAGLAQLGRRLAGEPSDDDVRYALDETLKAGTTLQTARWTTMLQALQKAAEKCLAEANSAEGPGSRPKLIARLRGLAQRLEGLPRTEYDEPARMRIESLLQQLREAQFKCAVQAADTTARYVRGELQRMTGRLTAAELAKNYATQQEAWQQYLDKAQQDLDQAQQAANNPLLTTLSASTFQQLAETRQDLGGLSMLMQTQQALAKLPVSWTTLKQWAASDAVQAAQDKEAKTMPAERRAALAKPWQETVADLARVREALTAAKPRLQFEEEVRQLEAHLEATAETLEAGALAQTRRHYQMAQTALARLDDLTKQHPALTKEAVFAKRIKDGRDRCRGVAARIDLLVAEQRQQAGWQPLPTTTTLAAPTPQTGLLRLELLLGDGSLADAEGELQQFGAAYPQPDWRTHADRLRLRLDFQSALACEAAGRDAEARQLYEQLVAARGSPTLAGAAHSALLRLTSREQRLDDDRQARMRAVILAILLLATLGAGLFFAGPGGGGSGRFCAP
ncbi:MAG: hypothetical protein NTY19_49800 [Planctomycetota bacterium]|nr:hypothetical protein [Planctomycetota bacterium]